MTLGEKTANLRGVIEGMNFDTTTNEGKLIAKLTDIVDDLAHAVEELEKKTDTTNDYVEELDYDLGDLEEFVYEDDDCECGCYDDDDCDCCDDDDDDCCCDDDDCDCCGDDDLYELECPSCHDKIYASEKMLDGTLTCPNCNAQITADADTDEK